jgi:transcriptional regulator of NAD metabolism
VRYADGMDHLEVLREKIARLRAEIAHIQESNQEYRLQEWNRTEAQVAHGERQERLLAIQRELAQVADLGRRIHSVEKMREMARARLHPVKQAQAS